MSAPTAPSPRPLPKVQSFGALPAVYRLLLRSQVTRARMLALGALGEFMGSRPEATEVDAPVPPCPSTPNCARLRVAVGATPLTVTEAVQNVFNGLGDSGLGEPTAYVPTPGGALASFSVGPFEDDVVIEVEPAPQGSILWVRSASRSGRSDLSVNARRADRIVAAIASWLPPEAMPTD